MSKEIGAVKAVVGKFWIQNADGEMHLAVVGEMLHEDDRIIGSSANTANSTLSLDLVGNGNKDIVLGANDVLMLDQTFLKDVLTMEDSSVQKASLVAAWDGTGSEELSIKIEDNKDALALADTTAAGDGETAAGGAASDGQITPAYFADRTGAFGDVRTGLTSVVNGSLNGVSAGTDTPDLNDRPVVFDITATVDEALDGSNTITGQLVASDADLTDMHKFYAVEGSLTVNGITLEGVTFVLNTDGTYTVSGDFNHLAVGENAVVSFQYYAVDDGLPIGAPHDSLPATVTLTVIGTNDQPIISDINANATGSSESSSETLYGTVVYETHDGLGGVEDVTTTFNASLATAIDDDVSDTHTYDLVEDTVNVDSTADITELGVTVDSNGNYHVTGNFNVLAAGQTATVTFQYVANDGHGFDGTDGINEKSVSEPKTVTLTITGTNDQPIVENVTITDFATETNGAETFSGQLAVTSDLDTADTHTFQQSGTASVETSSIAVIEDFSVVVDENGVYHVNGNFDHLAAGETATVIFQYYAVDSSATQVNGESNTSEIKTVTLTVTGTNDQPIVSDVNVNGTGSGVANIEEFSVFGPESGITIQVNGNDVTTSNQNGYYYSSQYSGAYGASGYALEIQDATADAIVTFPNEVQSFSFRAGAVNGADENIRVLYTDGSSEIIHIADNVNSSSNYGGSEFTTLISATAPDGKMISGFVILDGTDYWLLDGITFAGSGATVILESNGLETIYTGQLVLTTDLDTTDTHTFQQTGTAAVVTNGGSTAVVTDLSVDVASNGSYTVDGNFDALAAGETATVTFTYTATDDSGAANAVSEPKTVTLTVTGTNDQPIVSDVSATATETNGLETIYTGQLALTTDLDTTDIHTFQFVTDSAAVVTNGGSTAVVTDLAVVVNANGSYTVNGNFDALAAGETATVTFTYTARDDSATLNATSEAKTVTLTVTGTNDQPIVSNIAIGTTIVSENFETGATGWNNNLTTNGGELTNFLGRFAGTGGNEGISKTFDFGVGLAGKTVTINFDMYEIDSWDGEAFKVFLNGSVVSSDRMWIDSHYGNSDGGTPLSTNVFAGWSDEIHHYSLQAIVGVDGKVKLGFGTTLDQGISDESWGIDNLTIAVSNTVFETNGTQEISAGQLTVTDLDTTDTHTFQQSGTTNVTTSSGAAVIAVVNIIEATGAYTVSGNFDALAAGETATVTFSYTATDDSGAVNAVSEIKTVTLTVVGTNDSPVILDTSVTSGTATEAGNLDAGTPVAATVATGTMVLSDVDNGATATWTATGGEVSAYGSFVITEAGVWTYTVDATAGSAADKLAENESHVERFEVTVTDDQGATAVETVSITIKGTNDSPIATVDAGATDENTSVTVDVLNNDTDIDNGHTFTLTAVNSTKGTVSIVDNKLVFEANAQDFDHLAEGTQEDVVVTYTMSDEFGATSTTTATVTVTGTNDRPVISDVNANGTGSGEVIGLDTLADTTNTHNYGHVNDYHEAFIATQSELSKIEMEYHQLGSVVTSVKVNLVEVLANGTLGAVLYSSTETNLSSNNLVVDNLDFTLEVGKKYAISVEHLNGGQSSFDYDASSPVDNQGIYENGSFLDWAEIGMKLTYGSGETVILETNDLNEVTTFTGSLATATDLDITPIADTHEYTLVVGSTSVDNTTVTIDDSNIEVTPEGLYTLSGNFGALADGEKATVTFNYVATDNSGALNAESEAKTVTITITGTNDAPVISNVTVDATETNGTQTFNGQLLETDVDTTDTHTFQQTGSAAVVTNGGSTAVVTDLAVSIAANGIYTVNGNFDALAAGETATVTFQYTARDDSGTVNAVSAPKTVTLTVTGTNDQPIVSNVTVDATETNATQTFNGQLLETDLDTTDTHTFQQIGSAAVTTSSGATVSGLAVAVATDGTYTVNGNFDALAAGETATVTFQYTATDDSGTGNAVSVEKTVTLIVTGTNDQPIVSDVNANPVTSGIVTLSNETDFGITDFQTTLSSIVITDSGTIQDLNVQINLYHSFDADLVISLRAPDGTVIMLSNRNGGSANNYTNSVFDDEAATSIASGSAPFTGTFRPNGLLSVLDGMDMHGTWILQIADLALIDVGALLSWSMVIDTPSGTVIYESNGLETIYTGQLALTSDLDTTDAHTFQVAAGTTAAVTTSSAAAVTGLSVVVNANGSYAVNGNFDALADGETATVTFQYTATDNSGAANAVSEAKTVTLTVTGTNDAPIAVADTLSAVEDISKIYTVADLLGNDTDVDTSHANLTIASVTNGNNGTVVLNLDGTVTFTPTANYSGPADFTYTISDGALTSNPAKVTINVTPVADTPTLTIVSASKTLISENFEEVTIAPNAADNNYMYSNTVSVTALTGSIWTTDNKSGQLEIGQQKLYIGGTGTSNVIELERNASDYSLETKFMTSKGLHTLSLDYSPRTGHTGKSSEINVFVDGTLVKVLTSTIVGMTTYTVVLTDLVAGDHTLRFEAHDKNSIGGVLDNISLTEALNIGLAGQSIQLAAITAALTDSSESLVLTMDGVPNGFIISDGTVSHTVTGDGTTVDITGWSLNSLIVTPPSSVTGVTVDLTVTATSTESDGTSAMTSSMLELTVLPSTANDTIIFDSLYKSIDGGAGTDTLVLSQDTSINFGALGNVIKNIEVIDLSQNGAHTLNGLTVQDVFDMTDSAHTLTIFGDSADSVTLVNPTGADANHTWTQAGNNVIENGHTLDIYHNGDSTVTLKIEDTTTHTII